MYLISLFVINLFNWNGGENPHYLQFLLHAWWM